MIFLDREKAIKQGYLTANVDWYGGFVGLLHFFCLWFVSALFIWHNTSIQSLIIAWLFFLLFGAISIYAVHCISTERKLTLIQTTLKAAENRKLMLEVFKQLKWSVLQNTQQFIIANVATKWFEVGSFAIALVTENQIHLNVVSGSNTKGRIPFYFRNNKRLKLLIDTINQTI
ncbi:hypothetical protein [Hymenobacter jeongseonensis]|uniref:hypothetical protein n=1 Tax=Hymenobacter jeongseonensis TaxID=2791027 RepID=UPI0018AF7DBD|nr:hypothetical protein [Hymenobacter jeongseonensis]